ncbi:hypothetical protein SDC9_134361 [bioreactor metagenome]|uniref:Uncharacterized protein n=1 Tax=bioreactor metagenome TaxID=1076179 RepID=A0A645DDJ6_9ZZZZ
MAGELLPGDDGVTGDGHQEQQRHDLLVAAQPVHRGGHRVGRGEVVRPQHHGHRGGAERRPGQRQPDGGVGGPVVVLADRDVAGRGDEGGRQGAGEEEEQVGGVRPGGVGHDDDDERHQHRDEPGQRGGGAGDEVPPGAGRQCVRQGHAVDVRAVGRGLHQTGPEPQLGGAADPVPQPVADRGEVVGAGDRGEADDGHQATEGGQSREPGGEVAEPGHVAGERVGLGAGRQRWLPREVAHHQPDPDDAGEDRDPEGHPGAGAEGRPTGRGCRGVRDARGRREAGIGHGFPFWSSSATGYPGPLRQSLSRGSPGRLACRTAA